MHRSEIKKVITFLIISIITFLAACVLRKDYCVNPTIYNSDFTTGYDNWSGGFADWNPPYSDEKWGFVFERSNLPQPLDTSMKGLKIAGNNKSDDLFMFLKRKMSGLLPNTIYDVTFRLEIASNAPTDGVGAGGSPNALTIKAGAVTEEPDTTYDPSANFITLKNIDKGDQSQEGKDIKNLGDVGVSPGQKQYAIIVRENFNRPHRVRTNNKGEVWLMIGTDSGYESRSELHYKSIYAIFKKG